MGNSDKPLIHLWDVIMPNKVHEVAVLDENHLCVVMGFVLRIYEITEQGIILIAQTKVFLVAFHDLIVYRYLRHYSSCSP